MGVFSLGQATPHLQSVAEAKGAASTLWEIIDTVNKYNDLRTLNTKIFVSTQPSTITSSSPDGIQKNDLIGDIKFANVDFVYPSRPDVPVLNKLTLTAQSGQTTALVGTSGCGKVNISLFRPRKQNINVIIEYLYTITTTIL